MSYQRRMSIAGIAAAVLHVAALAAVAFYPRPAGPGASIRPDTPPLVVNLQPTPRQLVDVHTPSETPPEDSDRIAEFDSQATDTTPGEGDDGPQVELEQDFDAVATAIAPMETPAPEASEDTAQASPPVPAPETQPTETPVQEPEPEPTREPQPAPVPERTQVARRTPETAAPPTPRPEPTPPQPSMERTETARATPPQKPALPAEREAPLRGRTRGGVQQTGIAGFEAIQDDIAPYLQQIRAAVEREWTTALATRYTGSRPTEAVVECEIAPDGTVVRAEIIGAPDDRIYAAICQTSIVRAGPFGPFPFEIPDMYRNRNLQIRWSFAFISR